MAGVRDSFYHQDATVWVPSWEPSHSMLALIPELGPTMLICWVNTLQHRGRHNKPLSIIQQRLSWGGAKPCLPSQHPSHLHLPPPSSVLLIFHLVSWQMFSSDFSQLQILPQKVSTPEASPQLLHQDYLYKCQSFTSAFVRYYIYLNSRPRERASSLLLKHICCDMSRCNKRQTQILKSWLKISKFLKNINF